MICDELVHLTYSNMAVVDDMFNLRVACFELHQKTLQFCTRETFNSLCVFTSYRSFQNLVNICLKTPFAIAIR